MIVLEDGPGAGPPLTCVHSISGTVGAYVQLARRVRAHFGVRAFRADYLCPPQTSASLVTLAGCYVDELIAKQRSSSFRLLGYSVGGIIAFEMAQQLLRRGYDVEFLALGDSLFRTVFRYPDDWPWQAFLTILTRSAPSRNEVARFMTLDRSTQDEVVAHAIRDDDPRLAEAGTKENFVRRYRTFIDSLWRATAGYQICNFPRPIHYYRSALDDDNGSTERWRRIALGGLMQVDITASHPTLFEDPGLEQIAAHLRTTLSRRIVSSRVDPLAQA